MHVRRSMGRLRSILATTLVMCSFFQFAVGLSGHNGKVPALFAFGDSLVDNGNNNYMSSLAKANYYPYGIDFFQGPSGRFSNGRNIIDLLCDRLGIPYIPAYATPYISGSKLVGGVNYASAAGGILDESGSHLGERYSLSQQVINFESNLKELREAVGGSQESFMNEYVGRCVVMMAIGNNDYLNNYLLPSLYSTSYTYTPQQYADLLLPRLARQLLALHSLGLRKFFVGGLGPLGCIPNQRALGTGPPDRCVDDVNRMVGFFNEGLRKLVDDLNRENPGATFVYGNTYGAMGDLLNNPAVYGFKVIDEGCCGVGRKRGEITCLPYEAPCNDRNEYIFWDAFHPTQAVSDILAQRAYTGPPSDCYPMNLQQLAAL